MNTRDERNADIDYRGSSDIPPPEHVCACCGVRLYDDEIYPVDEYESLVLCCECAA